MMSVWNPLVQLSPPALMQSLNGNVDEFDKSFNFHSQAYSANKNSIVKPCKKCRNNNSKSLLLYNEQEKLQISNVEEFLLKLNCTRKDAKVKVVSIFGNTCNGESHTLNNVFFRGEEVFRVSNNLNCCTLGVWAAFDPILNVICLDTEGLLGITSCENEHITLLLKVLAVSDIVIYGIYSERLDRDFFTFLGTASRCYTEYFKTAFKRVGQNEEVSNLLNTFGPSIIVLHETMHAKPLTNNESESPEDILKTRFALMKLEIDAFSSIKYVGLQTINDYMYEPLRSAIETELNNVSIRSARKPHLVFHMLTKMNDQSLSETKHCNLIFPDQYFSCPVKCLSCNSTCNNNIGHIRKGKSHCSSVRCKFQCQYENFIYICRKCYKNGKDIEVKRRYEDEDQNKWYSFAKNVWSGYVIECSQCGIIYNSRQYWYGNNSEDVAIYKKITHVWNVSNCNPTVSQNTAQRVIDSVSYISEAVTNVSLQPTKALKAWAADQVAPSYWRSNSEIKHCYQCKIVFNVADDKHHCRDCGEGFCDQCSSKTKCVPHRNWYLPVRVCDACYEKETNYSNDEFFEPTEDVNVRKVTEHVVSTLNVVGSVLNYSKSFIKDSARPSYWIPDSEVIKCNLCERKFSVSLPLHHCRGCGCGVCHDCSQHCKPVPHRGWDYPVRVCNACV